MCMQFTCEICELCACRDDPFAEPSPGWWESIEVVLVQVVQIRYCAGQVFDSHGDLAGRPQVG